MTLISLLSDTLTLNTLCGMRKSHLKRAAAHHGKKSTRYKMTPHSILQKRDNSC